MYFLFFSFLLILQNKWLLRAQKWIEHNRFLNSHKIVSSIVVAVLTGLKMEFKLAGRLAEVDDALKRKNNHFICHT